MVLIEGISYPNMTDYILMERVSPCESTMVGIIGYNIIKGTRATKIIITAIIDVVHVRHSGVEAGMVLSSHVSSSVVCSRLTYAQSIPLYIYTFKGISTTLCCKFNILFCLADTHGLAANSG